jgi:hypothetical protein
MRKSPWIFFTGIDEEHPPLLEITNLNSALVRHILQEDDPRTILSLAFVFLRLYPKHKSYFENMCKFIAQRVSGLSTVRGKHFAFQAKYYQLFTSHGPAKVVRAIKKYRGTAIKETLSECGLNGGCQQEGFVEEMYEHWIKDTSTSLKTKTYHAIQD